MLEFLFDAACGLNTLTSRNVFSWRPPQNPFIETSQYIGGSVSKGFTSQGLEIWFHRDIMADFREKVGSDIPDFIVADRWKPSTGAREDVLDR